MTATAQEAIEDLYRVAVVEQKTTSPARLSSLAEFCIHELEKRGVAGVDRLVEHLKFRNPEALG